MTVPNVYNQQRADLGNEGVQLARSFYQWLNQALGWTERMKAIPDWQPLTVNPNAQNPFCDADFSPQQPNLPLTGTTMVTGAYMAVLVPLVIALTGVCKATVYQSSPAAPEDAVSYLAGLSTVLQSQLSAGYSVVKSLAVIQN
jgi:hypothetical protein